MAILLSKQHKEIVGSVNDVPYKVSFDADGFAYDVDDAVAHQLTSADYGVTLIDEDGAEVTAEQQAEADRLKAEAEEAERLKAADKAEADKKAADKNKADAKRAEAKDDAK